MEQSTIILLICGIYLLISLVAGIIPGLKTSNSIAGYVAGDRSMNLLVLYFVMGASIFSSFAFLGGPGWAYSRGAAAFYIIAYGITGTIPLYFFGPKTRTIGKKYGFVTQAEMLADRYNSTSLSVILAILSVIVFIPYLTLQMKGAGYILSTVSDGMIPVWLGAGFSYLIVIIYVYYSGVMGVGWTNTFQGIFMLIIAWFLGLYLPEKLYGGLGEMFKQLADSSHAEMLTAPGLNASGGSWNWWGFSSAVMVSAIGFSVWPHFFMKVFAAKSEKTIRQTVVLYPTFQLFLVPILIIGFSAILIYPNVEPADTILPYILTQLDLPALLVGLVCAGTLAASMSSGDAILHAAASISIRDGFAKLFPVNLETDVIQRRLIRYMVIVISLVSYYYAVLSDQSIVSLLLGAYGGVAQIFPLVFAAFYWPRATQAGALSALISGITVTLFFLFFPETKPYPLHEGIFGLIINIILLIGVSYVTKPVSQKHLQKYLEC